MENERGLMMGACISSHHGPAVHAVPQQAAHGATRNAERRATGETQGENWRRQTEALVVHASRQTNETENGGEGEDGVGL